MRKLVIASVLALSTVVFTSCNEGNAASKVKNENIKKAEKRDAAISAGAAIIEFDKTSFDFGTVAEGDVVNAEFEVTNGGKTDLIITKASPSCGCTVPTYPKKAILPGETANIDIKYATNRVGAFSKTITVMSNADEPQKKLRIKGTVLAKETSKL